MFLNQYSCDGPYFIKHAWHAWNISVHILDGKCSFSPSSRTAHLPSRRLCVIYSYTIYVKIRIFRVFKYRTPHTHTQITFRLVDDALLELVRLHISIANQLTIILLRFTSYYIAIYMLWGYTPYHARRLLCALCCLNEAPRMIACGKPVWCLFVPWMCSLL